MNKFYSYSKNSLFALKLLKVGMLSFMGMTFLAFNPLLAAEKKIEIKWVDLEIYPSPSGEKYAEVVLRGITLPNANVKLSNSIRIFQKSKVVDKLTEWESRHTQAEDHGDVIGFFELSLDLPRKTSHIPIEVSLGTKKSYYMLVVDLTEIQANLKDFDYVGLKWFKRSFQFGLGASYFEYVQTNQVTGLNLSHSKVKSFSYQLGGGYTFSRVHALEFDAHILPSETIDQEGLVIKGSKDINWLLVGVEYIYTPQDYNFYFLSKRINWGLKVGLQHHKLSYVNQKSVSEAEVDSTNLINANFGFLLHTYAKPLDYSFYLRYQVPLLNESDFFFVPNFNFDGGLNIEYHLSSQHSVSLLWFGQWLQNELNYYSSSLNTWYRGEQKLFFSNLTMYYKFQF